MGVGCNYILVWQKGDDVMMTTIMIIMAASSHSLISLISSPRSQNTLKKRPGGIKKECQHTTERYYVLRYAIPYHSQTKYFKVHQWSLHSAG